MLPLPIGWNSPWPPKEKSVAFVVSRQHRIYYDLDGDRGPYLLLYPSLWLDLESWAEAGYLEVLQQEYRVLRLDPLGQGRSDTSSDAHDYQPEARLRDLRSVLQELELENVHFLGIGSGARIGYLLAALEPYRLRSLAVLDAHPYALEPPEVELWQRQIHLLQQAQWAELRKISPLSELNAAQWERLETRSPQSLIAPLQAELSWPGVADQLPPGPSAPGMLFTCTREIQFLKMREAGRSCPYWRYHIFPQFQYQAGLLEAELLLPTYLEFVRRQRWVPRMHGEGS